MRPGSWGKLFGKRARRPTTRHWPVPRSATPPGPMLPSSRQAARRRGTRSMSLMPRVCHGGGTRRAAGRDPRRQAADRGASRVGAHFRFARKFPCHGDQGFPDRASCPAPCGRAERGTGHLAAGGRQAELRPCDGAVAMCSRDVAPARSDAAACAAAAGTMGQGTSAARSPLVQAKGISVIPPEMVVVRPGQPWSVDPLEVWSSTMAGCPRPRARTRFHSTGTPRPRDPSIRRIKGRSRRTQVDDHGEPGL